MLNQNELFEFQKTGSQWLSTKKVALLADEMGLGKSAQSIVACDGVGAERILVLCPAVARINWAREFEKFSWASRSFDVVFNKGYRFVPQNSVICSYDLANSIDPAELGKFDALIIDEGHFLKNINTKRTQHVLGKEGFVRYAKRIWVLTGTPAPNHAGELWPILYTFGCVSESYERFLEKYCTVIPTSYGERITGTKRDKIPELKKLLEPIMLRRLAKDVMADMPEISFHDFAVEPGFVYVDEKMKEVLREQEALMYQHIAKLGNLDILEILKGLSNSVATLRRYVGMQKVEPVANMVYDELNVGAYDKVVVFAHHKDVIRDLKQRFQGLGFDPVVVDGSSSPQAKQQAVDKFQTDPECKVFIGNILAAGTAITLTAANNVIFLEQDWVPGNNAQAAKRCHRIGQDRPVFVRVCGLVGSFDDRLSAILSRKAAELTALFDKKDLPIKYEFNNS